MTPIVETALRVLSAWNTRAKPNPEDIRAIRAYKNDYTSEVDELACEIVSEQIKPAKTERGNKRAQEEAAG